MPSPTNLQTKNKTCLQGEEFIGNKIRELQQYRYIKKIYAVKWEKTVRILFLDLQGLW